ncbi:hypothetical protein MET9862_01802 [Methylobacterium symbioticum]|uniref:Uncharacterized protein n=1 Tax=Methylobacterium symbioticum TaxID=2584084 RepID=A0A509ECJ1_9HYPH|nr:hypothetical protein MET9862_01802 [Methylobacterium symbioticum]
MPPVAPTAAAAMPASTERRGASLARAPIETVLLAPIRAVTVLRGSVAASSPWYQITVLACGVRA